MDIFHPRFHNTKCFFSNLIFFLLCSVGYFELEHLSGSDHNRLVSHRVTMLDVSLLQYPINFLSHKVIQSYVNINILIVSK